MATSEEIYDQPLLSVRAVSTALIYFEGHYGRARLEQVAREQMKSVTLEQLQVLTNYISLRQCEDCFDALLAASGAPDFCRQAGLSTATPAALGFLFHVMRAVANPRTCYQKTVELGATYNRVGKFELEVLEGDHATLVYTSQVRERNRNICELRMGQFASFPTIWGMPPAEVVEETCHVEGAAACRYHLRWRNPLPAWRRYAGAAAGAAAGAVSWKLGGVGALGVGGLLAAGGATGAWLDLRAVLRRKNDDLRSQTAGLEESLRDLTRRHEELEAARVEVERTNRELESRVTQRTQELATANTSLEGALEKARELDRLKTEFFDNVSHELRTPLSLILLSLDSLSSARSATSPAQLASHLDTLERSASRLLRLINQLLDVAKLEAGKMRLRYEPMEVHGFMASLLIPFRQLAARNKITLEVVGGPCEPVQVDAEKIDVVFQNLLSNALKFTPPGGKVQVKLTELADSVQVEVQDTGMGIPEADLPVIFDRFAQADSQGIKRFGGTGIGLALVRETVEIHGGTIGVRSKVGEGTCFTVKLPRGSAHIREDLRERRSTQVAVGRERRQGPEPLSSVQPRPEDASLAAPSDLPQVPADAPRVLVVEDDPDLRRAIVGALRNRYRVIEAADGVEGTDRALAEKPDLIVSDLMMPRRSGLQLLEIIRREEALAEVPFILLTARRETDAVVEGLETGANDYLGKPFAVRELLARVDVQLRLRDAAARSVTSERLAALGMLTTGFAHEVRNPLNGLLNAVEPLRSCLADPAGAKDAEVMLDLMRDCGQRVQKLSESLLGFARPAGQERFVNLTDSLDSTIEVLRWRLTPGVSLERDFQAKPAAAGDAAALNQVWLNLLDNALRAVGDKGTVRVSTEEDHVEIRVRIHDTGPGIPADVRQHLFQPFFSTRPAGEGTGLGLALCRRIVAAHQGRITVESEPGKGSTFVVHLPALPAVAAQKHAS